MPIPQGLDERRTTIVTETLPRERLEQQEASGAFAVEAARLAAHTRCHQVAILDLRHLSPVADYFVLATGTSARQMRTVIDQIMELGAKRNHRAIHLCGHDGENWILADFVDVVVHVFSQDARQYYDLDNLWGDAPHVDWEPDAA